jgi:hypothetical protein
MVDLKGLRGVASLLLGAIAMATVAAPTSAETDSRDRADLWADTAEDIDEAPGYEDTRDSRRE